MQVTLHPYSQQQDNIIFGAQEKTETCHIGSVDTSACLGALDRRSWNIMFLGADRRHDGRSYGLYEGRTGSHEQQFFVK